MKLTSHLIIAAMSSLILIAGCARSGGGGGDPDASDAEAQGPSLEGTRWLLAALDEKPAEVADDEKQLPYLVFSAQDNGVSGSTGVNFLSGKYERDGDSLKFGPLITTRRAGPPALMQQEVEFNRALQRTAGWRIRGGGLELLDADGNLVARFRAATAPTAATAGSGSATGGNQ